MKKILALTMVLALLLPVLAGCQSSAPAQTQTDPPASSQETTVPEETTLPPETTVDTTPVVTDPVTTTITRDEAISIALKDAGLTKDQVRDLEAELDTDDGTPHYDVDFEKDKGYYDYEIHAETGKILKKDVPAKATTTSTTETKQLTKAEVQNIALKHAGFTADQVRDLEVELDTDDGTRHFDVDFEKDGYDYSYEIDAASGKILKSEKERD